MCSSVCISYANKKLKEKTSLKFKWNCQNKFWKTKCFDRGFGRIEDKENTRIMLMDKHISWAPQIPILLMSGTEKLKNESSWWLQVLYLKVTLTRNKWLLKSKKHTGKQSPSPILGNEAWLSIHTDSTAGFFPVSLGLLGVRTIPHPSAEHFPSRTTRVSPFENSINPGGWGGNKFVSPGPIKRTALDWINTPYSPNSSTIRMSSSVCWNKQDTPKI